MADSGRAQGVGDPEVLAIDLCAGIGWNVACQQLGISELGIEIMPEAIATRDAMGALTQNVSIADLPDDYCRMAPLQIAGPPCQTFSPAGKGEGRRALDEVLRRVKHLGVTGELIRGGAGDPRTWLVLEPLRLALGGMPMFVVWEQVPPVLPVWQACAEVLRAAGYSVWTGNLSSEQYGVPQTRKRAFLIARRDGRPAAPPSPTHSRYYPRDPARLDAGVSPWISMADALRWGPVSRAARDSLMSMRSNYGTGGDPRDRGERQQQQPAPTITSKIDRNRWVYRSSNMANSTKRSLDTPAPTVMFGRASNKTAWMERDLALIPSESGIRVTVEEAATLQTFPCPELIQGSQTKRYLQVGNMVPPLLGTAILRTFLP